MEIEKNTEKNRPKIKNALLQLAPGFLGMVALALFIVFYRIVLEVYADSVGSNMKNGHFLEISKGDFYGLAQKLNALSKGLTLDCFSLTVNQQTFMNMNPSLSCSLWPINIKQTVRPDPHLEIVFWARLPRPIELTALAIFCAQVLVIFLSLLSVKAREKLKQLYEKQLYAMAIQTAHDIKSPLAVLKATFFSAFSSQNEEHKLLAKRAIESIDQMAIQLLNKYRRSTPTYLNIEVQEAQQSFSLSVLLQEVLEEKKVEKNASINFQLTEKSNNHFFKVDKINFKRILSNLINNSLEAKSTKINLHLNIEEEECTLLLQDNGPGFPLEILRNFKGDFPTVLSETKGTGIGLISSQKQIEKWGGSLSIQNSPGAQVKIILRRDSFKNVYDHVHCDNDPLILLTWKAMAKKVGINLLSLSSPQELLEDKDNAKNISPFAKIYLDYELGLAQNGLFWAHHLKEKNPGWSIYLSTGHPKEFFLKDKYFESVVGVMSKSPTFY